MITARVLRDGREHITFASESDIQDGAARLAEAYGWDVEREVVIPGWGRIDMVLHSTPRDYWCVVEFKQSLTRLSNIRRAFQQADGYYRWLTDHDRLIDSPVFLVAAAVDHELANDIAFAYRESVRIVPLAEFMGYLGQPDPYGYRIKRARERLEQAAVTYRLAVHAVNRLRP